VSRFTTKTVSNWGISGSGDVEGEAITGKRHSILLRIAHSTQSVLMGSYFGCFRDANSTFAFPHNIAISCNSQRLVVAHDLKQPSTTTSLRDIFAVTHTKLIAEAHHSPFAPQQVHP
jgi:hypothetical protein